MLFKLLLMLLITFDVALWNSTSNKLLHISVLSKEKNRGQMVSGNNLNAISLFSLF